MHSLTCSSPPWADLARQAVRFALLTDPGLRLSTGGSSAKPTGILDTSFWTVGFKVGVLGYALGAFDMVVPDAVDVELRAPDIRYPSRVYPETALYLELRPQLLRPPPRPEPPRLRSFGVGEAAAIALAAQEKESVLLINDHRPAQYARNLGIAIVTVPSMIVVARAQQLLPDQVARALLASSQRHGTAPAIVAEALSILDSLL